MPSATDLTLDIAVTVDARALAKAIRRLAEDDRDRLRGFAQNLADNLFIDNEEVADDFARWFAEAHQNQPRF